MGYSNYKSLRQTLEKLALEEIDEILFPYIQIIEPSNWLQQSLALAELLPLTNEKTKSERLISPILMEVAVKFTNDFTLFSGEELLVDSGRDLSGECDFFFAKHPRKSVMQAPIVTLVEAKDENFEYGQAQCIAQMYASMLYNEQKGKPMPCIYGCAVTGDVWKFLKLEKDKVYIDVKNYYLIQLPQILGIFHQILNRFLD
ncbi:MAG: hypothetical protein ACKVTZ_18385 [Bacteroidia bacterium]